MDGPGSTGGAHDDARTSQGTVARYDGATRSGAVLLDDGVLRPFGAGTVRADVRHLRVGQRVHLDLRVSDDVVTGVRIH